MDLIRDMLNRASGLLSEGKTIVEWFDPKSYLHRGAFQIYCKTGSWPEGVIPENVTLTPGFRTALVEKLHEAMKSFYKDRKLPDWVWDGINDVISTMKGNPEEMNLEKALAIVGSRAPNDEWNGESDDSRHLISAVSFELEKYGIMEGKVPDKDDTDAKLIQKLTEAGIKENEVRDIWVVIRPQSDKATMDDVVAKSSPRRLMIMAKGGLDPEDLVGVYDNDIDARKKGSALLGAGVAEKKVNEGPLDTEAPEAEAGAGLKDPGFKGKKEPAPGEKEEEAPVGDLDVDDEHEAVEADFDKIYLGQDDTNHYYVIAKKDEEGSTEDLLVTDQEGKELFSAKENGVDVHDVGKFILAAINSDKVKIRELEREVVIQYLVPEKEEELGAGEEEDEEGEGSEGEEATPKTENEPPETENPDQERPMESRKVVTEEKVKQGWYVENSSGKQVAGPMKEQEAKQKAKSLGGDEKGFSVTYVSDYQSRRSNESKVSETVTMKDGKGNTFSLQIVDEGGKDVVVQINNREFRFKPDFVGLYEMDGGKLTEKGLQDMATELISHLREDEYAEVVGSGVQEDLDPSVTKKVGEDTLLQRAQQLRAKKDRTPDDDATLRQLEDELKNRGQGATEGKVPEKDDDEAKMVKKLTEDRGSRVFQLKLEAFLEKELTPEAVQSLKTQGLGYSDTVSLFSQDFAKALENVLREKGWTVAESKISEQYLDESEEFQSCASHGGRVRTVSGPDKEHGLKAGEYVHYCYLGDKSFRGEVKTKKNESKVDEMEQDGLAKKAGKKPEDFDKVQLEAGTKVEMEHTDDPAKARQIAMDHLTEDPNYYIKLKKVEGKMNEHEHSDLALQADTKKVFKVDFVLDTGEKRSTKVMAMDKFDAERMLKRQKGVTSVTNAVPVAGAKESKIEEDYSESEEGEVVDPERLNKARRCGRSDRPEVAQA